MHKSAMLRMSWFVDSYIKGKSNVRVLDVGSYDVNGCMRPLFDGADAEYVELDIEAGPNVDVVMNNPYNWDNVPDESFDFVISANAFEHIEYPWLTIKLIHSKLKQGGIACIHAPNTIGEHRYPVDCYRYFPDGFRALAKWAGFQVISSTLGGVPSLDVPKEWTTCDDTVMVLIKSDVPVDVESFPALKYERRAHVVIVEATSSAELFKIWMRRVMPGLYSFLWKLRHPFMKLPQF